MSSVIFFNDEAFDLLYIMLELITGPKKAKVNDISLVSLWKFSLYSLYVHTCTVVLPRTSLRYLRLMQSLWAIFSCQNMTIDRTVACFY